MSRPLNILRLTLLALLMAAAPAVSAQDAPPMTVKARSDSTTLVMGDRTTVNVEVLKNTPDGVLVGIPERGKDYYGLELIDIAADSTDLGNGRIQLVYHLVFQAFDPADLLTLPGFRYAAAGDTAVSDILTFKVLPVELSPELGDPANPDSLRIHADEPVVSVHSRFYDYIPDWTIWALVGLALAALAVVLWMLYKKNGPAIFTPRKPVPPYELAIGRLQRLKDKHLIENGLGKQFYTEVTDIWRSYLEGRFGISAMEMTSRQILQQLRANRETHMTAAQMEQILQISDFVKFAALNPTREEMVRAFDTILGFVESTRPAPEPDTPDSNAKPENNDR